MGFQMSYGGGKSCIEGPTSRYIQGTLKRITQGRPFALDINDLKDRPQLLKIFDSALSSHKVSGHGRPDTVFKVSTDSAGNNVCFSSSFSKIDGSPDELSPDLYQAILTAKSNIKDEATTLAGLFQITQIDEL